MKLNKKGFMMAEVVVVSAIILIFLAGLFVSYNQIYGSYKSRVRYYDSVALYRLAYYRDMLIDNHEIANVLNETRNNKITDITNFDNDKVYIIYNNKSNLIGNELDDISDINETYKDYIKFLSTSIELKNSDYVMVIERCNTADDCKYAYLEVYDGS